MSSLLDVTASKLRRKSSSLNERFNRSCSCPTLSTTPENPLQGLAEYKYTPLSKPSASRVFELYPAHGDQPIRGALHEISLEEGETTPFISLSYVWGTSRKPHLIECNGGYILITCHLHSALLRLREKSNRTVLFADSICINQASDDEAMQQRAAQVSLMDRIYGGATTVIVDLGDERNGSTAVVELLTKIASVDPDVWANTAEDYQKGLALGMPPALDPLWGSFSVLCQRPWFERTWVVQEFSLARDVLFMVGHKRFSLDTLYEGIQRCVYFDGFSHLNDPNQLKDSKKNDEHDDNEDAERFGLLSMMKQLRDTCQNTDTESRSLGELLHMTVNFRATRQHDKVYALLGMISPRERASFRIDYQESIRDLSRRLTTFLLDAGEVPEVLSYHAAYDAGVDGSWMVDLTIQSRVEKKVRDSNWVWLDNYRDDDGLSDHFQACGDLECRFVRPSDQNLLLVSGGFLTEVVDLSTPIPDELKFKSISGRIQIFVEMFRIWKWDRNTFKMISRHLSDMPEAERLRLYRSTIVAHGKYLEAGIIPGWPDIAQDLDGHLAAVEEVISYLSSRDAKTLLELSKAPFDNDSVLKKLTAYLIHVAVNCSRRRLCVTKRGSLGLVPRDTKTGDMVAILSGCPLPFVVRRKKGSHWRLIGTAYLPGFMNGEALELPDWEVEGIVLC